ncbi:MAG: phage portal protein, partial [Alphaproteobacteria bacterium]|nr:phage portal protein [Alphaproteobacteria bacterium]
MEIIDKLLLGGAINFGRKRIILDYDEVTPENVEEVLGKCLSTHASNKNDCQYLIDYFLGKQDILTRSEPKTSTINNTTVVNYAYPITREIVGYTFGNPIELVQNDIKYLDDVNKLSNIYNYENAYYVDICTAIFDSICGVAYQMTLPNSMINKDDTPDVPIKYMCLDPRYTFVAFSNSTGNPQILSGQITVNENGQETYTLYTDNYVFKIDIDGNMNVSKNIIGLNPITMVENSLFLTGDWEQALSVLNATNQVTSDALNDIEGTIKSLLVVLGAEFDDDDNATLKKIKEDRVLTLTNATGGNLDAKFISPQLDSTSVQNIREYLEDARNIITGIPDRENNGGGGDTGTAVLNRNGWTDIEIVAKLKELFFKKGKKKQLEVGIKILKILDILSEEFSVIDVEPVIGRHTTDNLQTKTQAFATLVATGELATIDCLEFSGLTNRVREVVERGKKEREDREKEAITTEEKMTQDGQN